MRALISSSIIMSIDPFKLIADEGHVLLQSPHPIQAASSTWTTLFSSSNFIAFATQASLAHPAAAAPFRIDE